MSMQKSNKPIIKHITGFLEYIEVEKGLSPLTVKNYDEFLNRFRKWLISQNLTELKPHQLSPELIWKYRLYLSRSLDKMQKSLKKSTQAYYLIALRGFLNYFTEKDILSLPADKIKLPKLSLRGRKINFLTLEQIEKLLLAPDISNKIGLRDKAILETLFSTGLRVSELTALNRDQINMENIKKNKFKDLELGIVGKGGVSRVVYFSERALSWIIRYLEIRKDEDKALFINFRLDKNNISRRLTSRSIENIVKKYVKQTGLPITTTPHTIRHSYATDLLNQGVDLRAIQEFLGHRNIVTTQLYTHVTNKRLRDIHRKFHGGSKLKE